MKKTPATRKILLTGFESFGEWLTNPTEVAVNELNGLIIEGIQIVGKVIPLRYAEIEIKLDEYVNKINPTVIVLSGQAGGSEIRLERIAKNFVQTKVPYNCGTEFAGNEIVTAGPEKLHSTLPLEKIMHSFETENIPVRYSDHSKKLSFSCSYLNRKTRTLHWG